MHDVRFRIAQSKDLPTLTTIYNQAIHAHQTADSTLFTTEQRQPWFDAHQLKQYPLYVVLLGQQIVGYGTLSKYRGGRGSLRGVVEISYYLEKEFQGHGIGTTLLRFLLVVAKRLEFKHAYALLLDSNLGSVKLLENFGFDRWGHLPEIAERDGTICGQFIYGLRLN